MEDQRAAELDLAHMPHDRDAWIAVLVENPVLIQRPILITDDGGAVIGRTDRAVLSVIDVANGTEAV